MEGLFRQVGIFSQVGQLYRPQDADQLMYYREDPKGQILQEGINEPGAMASFIAAGTSYSTSNVPMIPFYIYYSMFGFQRVGDLAWAAGDMRTRGFLIGGTSGRTTLNGEGLQHEDGHSHILASTIPNCVTYDPTYAYEVAVIVHAGLNRMLVDQDDVFYYITTLNENYAHPAMPEGVEEGILRGAYKLREVKADQPGLNVRLLGAGAILREVEAAAEMLASEHGVSSEVWSVTSFTELRREGLDVERWNLLHPEADPKIPFITRALSSGKGPVIASTDYMKAVADGIRAYVPSPYKVLGTDGFGRSDYRRRLRSFFEIDRYHVAVASLKALAEQQLLPTRRVAEAIAKYGIDPEGPNPARKLTSTPEVFGPLRRAPVAKIEVKVPDIGDFKDVPVIEVLVKPGDVVKLDQSLITLEFDKATMDVPSPVEGAVAEILAKVGDKVSMGTLIARVEFADGKTAQGSAAPGKAAAPRK